ncbi:Spo0B domain-containing protein [Mechercharimyces sp. CAU 1602]|uniref:Spo0B domain-containing protein n=1 Tax=Mechercharimyces sp. CAU 1602 TaxID=2973933 RepID=UPI0021622958|nr:Spo0B domain-containing protein [Mechercharimyces sp. CAU 1602]MCS1351427.1 Spo0B domain-containing protein [Mechercharimyces sp. CAU 1602]
MGIGWKKWTYVSGPAWFFLVLFCIRDWNLTGQALIAVALLFSFLNGAWLLSRYIRNDQAVKQAEQAVNLIRRMRHDWMNHVQVLMGYASLKKMERILPYLQRLAGLAMEEREVRRATYPPLVLFLMGMCEQYSQFRWSVEIDPHFRLTEEKQGTWLLEVIEETISFLSHSSSIESETPRIFLHIKEVAKGSGQLVILFSLHETNFAELGLSDAEWRRLRQILRRKKAKMEIINGATDIRICSIKARSYG